AGGPDDPGVGTRGGPRLPAGRVGDPPAAAPEFSFRLPPSRPMEVMTHQRDAAAWRRRAKENLQAVRLLADRSPPLTHAAVSRLYYAAFQAVMARLLAQSRVPAGARPGRAGNGCRAPGRGPGPWRGGRVRVRT